MYDYRVGDKVIMISEPLEDIDYSNIMLSYLNSIMTIRMISNIGYIMEECVGYWNAKQIKCKI